MPVHITTQDVQLYYSASWHSIPAATVIDAAGSEELTGNQINAFSFGDESVLSMQVDVLWSEVSGLDLDQIPIRATFTVDAGSTQSFTGVVIKYSGSDTKIKLECTGYGFVISRKMRNYFSPAFYYRWPATKTTALSVEDPTNPACVSGSINQGLWHAGGRPYEQAASYPSALFYYSCDNAIVAPRWSWFAGEDGWANMLILARSSGGQIYQDRSGVIRYKQVLGYGDLTPAYTYADRLASATDELGVYDLDSFTWAGDTIQLATRIEASYTPRLKRPLQEIYSDTDPKTLKAGEQKTFKLEPKWPLATLDYRVGTSNQLPDYAIRASRHDTQLLVSGNLTHTVQHFAQMVELTINNTGTLPLKIWKLLLKGEPITSGDEKRVTIGSGDVMLNLENNDFVQTEEHVIILGGMTLASHNQTRLTRSFRAPYNPARRVGEMVNVSNVNLGLASSPHLITSLRHSNMGKSLDLQLVSVVGLSKTSDYFLIGTTNYTGQTKKVGY